MLNCTIDKKSTNLQKKCVYFFFLQLSPNLFSQGIMFRYFVVLLMMGSIHISLYAELIWNRGNSSFLSHYKTYTTEELMIQQEKFQAKEAMEKSNHLHTVWNDTDYKANLIKWAQRSHKSQKTKHPISPLQFTAATINDTLGINPPDTMGTVGPTQYIIALNGRIRSFHKKNGGLPDGGIDIVPEIFFGPPPPPLGNSIFANGSTVMVDARIRFDRDTNRWFIIMIDLDVETTSKIPAGNNNVHLAVSDGPIISLNTVWKFFFFNPSVLAGQASSVYFADFPTIGIDSRSLYISTEVFPGTPFPTTCNAFVINKFDLIHNPSPTVFFFNKQPDGTPLPSFVLQGAEIFETDTPFGFFIGAGANPPLPPVSNKLSFFIVSYDDDNVPSISNEIAIPVDSYSNPLPITQPPGGTEEVIPLNPLDARLCNCHVRNGLLYTSHAIGVDSTGTSNSASRDRTGSRWYQIDITKPLNPIVLQSGTVFDSTPNKTNFWMPSTMTNGLHSLILGCSSSGPFAFANATFLRRFSNDPLNTLSPPFIYTNSTLPFELLETTTPREQSWGDYSNSSLDPNDNMTLWTIQEFADPQFNTIEQPPTDGETNNFGAEVIRIPASPPASIVKVIPSKIPLGKRKITLKIIGERVDGSAFYDPGPTFPNRLQVKIGKLHIHAVRFISPTVIEVDVSTKGIKAGFKKLVITNPDGQSVVGKGFIRVIHSGILSSE